MNLTSRAALRLDPPLVESEVAFLAGFSHDGVVRRVWPGQPSRHCPWRPTEDGFGLELDHEMATREPDSVVAWLRFLTHEFLAPASSEALDTALSEGLRGGHEINGVLDLPSGAELRVERGRVSEQQLLGGPTADVLDLDAARGSHELEDHPAIEA